MASKSKSIDHSQSKSPSTSPRTSSLHSETPVSKQEEEESTTIGQSHHTSERLSPESPEVHSLIQKLKGFSISPQKFEVPQGSETWQFNLPHPLTRLQSGKLGIKSTELPLPKRKKAKKNSEGSDSETFSSSSSISSSPLQSQTSTPPLHIVVQRGSPTSTSQPIQSSIPTPPQTPGTSSAIVVTSKMAQNPWNSPGAVTMPAPLHPLPDYPEKWLPKFNLYVGTLAEEHINNFMLSVNLKGVIEEDDVVRIFPYTLQGSAVSWYFSLPFGSITSWNIFQEQFLTKYGDDRSLATLINDLSNLRIESREPIKEFKSRFNKILNKILTDSKPSEKIRSEWYITALPQI